MGIVELHKSIKEEMMLFYGIVMSDQEVMEFIDSYYINRLMLDPNYSDDFNGFEFETSEREDCFLYLQK